MPLIVDEDLLDEAVQPVSQVMLDRLLTCCEQRAYRKKTLLCREGEACDKLFYILEGTAMVTVSDDNGNEVILAYLKRGDFIGELGVFYSLRKCSAQVRARSDCKLAVIRHTDLQQRLANELKDIRADLLQAIGMQLAKRLLGANRRVTRLAYMDVAGRIARTILDMCQEPEALSHPEGTQIRISRTDIGRIVGCSRETVGRVLKQMADDGMIQVKGMKIVVFHSR